MKIYDEISIRFFDAWSGGEDTMDELNARLTSSQWNDLEAMIEDALDCEGEGITATELNDFLWYETDTIAEFLGFRDWDAFINNDGFEDDEEEYDEDDEDEEDDTTED